MSVYLEYRLEKSNIPLAEIRDIRIYTKEEWIFQDLRAELVEIFPTTAVSSFNNFETPGGGAPSPKRPWRAIFRRTYWCAGASPGSPIVSQYPPCDMVFIPFMSITDTFRYKYSAFRDVLKLKPRYIGFYEYGKRHLTIEKRKALPLFFARKIIEYVLRFMLRIKNKIPRSKTGETRPK